MSSNSNLQQLIHKMEEGNLANVVKLVALAFLGLGVLIVVIFDPMYWSFFRGLSHDKGIEQVQIAREIAAGNGYSTHMIRPLAMRQIERHLEATEAENPQEEMRSRLKKDTYHAPLWSATLAPVFKVMQGQWEMDPKRPIYILDKAVAVFSILLLYAAVVLNYFTFRRLFDTKLALIASGMQLVTYPFWQYAMSGLPHMLMLLIFSGIVWTVVRAIEAKEKHQSELRWILLAAVLGGLLVLTHYVTAWLLIGLLVFILIYFPSRLRNGFIFAGVILLMVSPWLVRNYSLTGNPLGIAWASTLNGVAGSEDTIMRRFDAKALDLPFRYFRHKIQHGLTAQFSSAADQLGGWIAPLFFVALLYPFRRTSVRVLRWGLLLGWLVAVLGMAVASGQDTTGGISATNLHLLFIPAFAAYGTAFILTLWSGLKIRVPLLYNGFIVLILFLAGLPFINALLNKTYPLWWPPYAPPYMAFLEKWTKPEEIIVSDMPWAVAWYARRDSLWLPVSPEEFLELHDFDRLGRPYGGMFLTPITESAGFMNEIVRGKYKPWIAQILRTPSKGGFPFPKGLPLGPQQMCIFYSDYERWSTGEADAIQKMQEKAEEEEAKLQPGAPPIPEPKTKEEKPKEETP